MICHTGNIDMTQCMIYFTNEKVSRKKKCSILFICVNVQSNWHIEAWVSTQASFINSPPPPSPREHTENVVTASFFMKKPFTLLCVYSTWAPHYHMCHFLQHLRLSRCHSHVEIELKSCTQKQINLL